MEATESLPSDPYRETAPQISRPPTASMSTLESVERKAQLFGQTIATLEEEAFSPENRKVFSRRWSVGKAADMVGYSSQQIRNKENSGELPAPDKGENGRRLGYTLEQINHMRRFFGTLPWRAPTDEPAVVAFSSFKGGCGKSTMSVHFAQHMALKGYRVLMIDCDPQGSASTLFGMNPDLEQPSGEEDDLDYSLEEYLANEFTDFRRCIRASYFPGIDIVPSSLNLFNAEYRLAADLNDNPALLNDLRNGIQSVWQDYDVVVLDPPPALGLLSLSVLNAANALVIPMRPTFIDFASTRTFLTMLYTNLRVMIEADFPIFYHFETLLVNNMDDAKSAHLEITGAMRSMFSNDDLLDGMMKDSAEIDNAGKEMMTVYDLQKPMTSSETHKRCVTYLERVNGEIETRVRKIWPSHRDRLREEAQL